MLNSTVGFSCCKQYGAEIIELKRNYSYLGRWQLCFVDARLQALTQTRALTKKRLAVFDAARHRTEPRWRGGPGEGERRGETPQVTEQRRPQHGGTESP